MPVRLGTLKLVIDMALQFATLAGEFKRTNTRIFLTIKETSCRGSIFNYTGDET